MKTRSEGRRAGRRAIPSVLLLAWVSCGGPPAEPEEPLEPARGGGLAPAPLRGTVGAEDAGGAAGPESADATTTGEEGRGEPSPPAGDAGAATPHREEYVGPGTPVRTAAEFVAAVAAGARVVVVADEIDLSDLWPDVSIPLRYDARGGPPPPAGNDHVRWTNPYDGWQMEIHDVQGIEIIGHGSPPPRLVTNPRGSFVIKFVEAETVAIENLSLGHTTPGFCRGGVLAFENVKDLRVRDADLFGSGTYGLEMDRVRGAVFERIAVHDCTYGIAVIRNSKDVVFLDSTFRHNEEFELVQVERTRGVRFERCAFEENRTHGDYPFFAVTASEVELVEAVFRNNAVEVFRRGEVKITSGTFEGNPFERTISPI